jgi:SAM-dependent methyltransferase
MKPDVLESIAKMTVNGNRLELPKKEHFSNYGAVKKALINAGGRYNKNGFCFKDAQATYDSFLAGEVRHDKKKFQFFATPDRLAQQLVDHADVQPHHRVLEPSAGQGAILNPLVVASGQVMCVEIMPENIEVLQKKGYYPVEADFLTLTETDIGTFDRIVANPPFTKNQDIDHILHMFEFLKPGGRLVSVASKSWTFGSQKRQKEFRSGLEWIGAQVLDIPAGAFKESGTQIAAVIIIIDKPDEPKNDNG